MLKSILRSKKHGVFLGVLALSIGCPAPVSATSIVFSSGTNWEVFNADPATTPSAIPLGPAQMVCLNAVSPPGCPSGATLYGYVGNGWGADLSTIPGAAWIWANGVNGATFPAELQQFFFSKTFLLGNPVSGTISVAVDDFAAVLVNGVIAGTTGSVTDMNSASLAQGTLATFDITPFLRTGSNVVTIHAQNGPPSFAGGCPSEGCTYAMNPAGVVFGGSLSEIPANVPEPESGALSCIGALALALFMIRRK
jgi:hypothetical protein